jgi:hypothetical protein
MDTDGSLWTEFHCAVIVVDRIGVLIVRYVQVSSVYGKSEMDLIHSTTLGPSRANCGKLKAFGRDETRRDARRGKRSLIDNGVRVASLSTVTARYPRQQPLSSSTRISKPEN